MTTRHGRIGTIAARQSTAVAAPAGLMLGMACPPMAVGGDAYAGTVRRQTRTRG